MNYLAEEIFMEGQKFAARDISILYQLELLLYQIRNKVQVKFKLVGFEMTDLDVTFKYTQEWWILELDWKTQGRALNRIEVTRIIQHKYL